MQIRKKSDILKQENINAIYYGDCEQPKSILGYHEVEEGGLFCYWNPLAKSMWICHRETGKSYKMQEIKEGFFIYFIKKTVSKDCSKEYFFEFCSNDSEERKAIENPYVFDRQIENMDCIAFEQGKHTSVYQILGAHKTVVQVEKERIEGVRFALYAPHAKRVSVLGEWNQFHPLIHPMERLDESGIFEIWIPEAKEGMEYEFEIKTQLGEVIRRGDPYRIACVRRKKRRGVIKDTSYCWKDFSYRCKRKEEKKDSHIFYHFDPQLYQKKGKKKNRFMTYRQITKEVLEHITEMGYTDVLIKGILEHDNEKGEEAEGNVIAYFAPSALYGTLESFQYFVNALHKRGLGVYLEWPISGFSADEDGLAFLDGQPLYEYEEALLGVHADGKRHRFFYGKGQVQSFLLSNFSYWVEEYHIDGFLIGEVATMLYQDYGRIGEEWIRNPYGEKENLDAVVFLQTLNKWRKEQFPFVSIFAQDNSGWIGLTEKQEKGGLGFDALWNQEWIHDYLNFVKYAPPYRQYDFWKMQYKSMRYFQERGILSMTWTDTPLDNGAVIKQLPGEYFYRFAQLRLLYGYMFGVLGDKALFMGEDFVYFHSLERTKGMEGNRKEEQIHRNFQWYIKDLIAFYKTWILSYQEEYDGLDKEEFMWFHTEVEREGILSFIRQTKERKLFFVFHIKREMRRNCKLIVPWKGKYELLFHSDRSQYGGIGSEEEIIKEQSSLEALLTVNLPPFSVLIFSVEEATK